MKDYVQILELNKWGEGLLLDNNNKALLMIDERTYEEVHQWQYRHAHLHLHLKRRRSARSMLLLGFQLSCGDAEVVFQLKEQPLKDNVSK